VTEQPKNNTAETIIMASTDAMLYGVGFIKVTKHPTGMTISRIPQNEWEKTAEQLKHLAKANCLDLQEY
jgi:hypothetical protein